MAGVTVAASVGAIGLYLLVGICWYCSGCFCCPSGPLDLWPAGRLCSFWDSTVSESRSFDVADLAGPNRWFFPSQELSLGFIVGSHCLVFLWLLLLELTGFSWSWWLLWEIPLGIICWLALAGVTWAASVGAGGFCGSECPWCPSRPL